jgi:voltage-gated potassium channel
MTEPPAAPPDSWRARLHEIVFEADTPEGKAFDVLLLVAIVVSVVAVMLESVSSIAADHGPELRAIEWLFTGLFTVEYVLRLGTVRRPLRYATSFYGIVDLLSVVPTWLSLLLPGTQSLLVIRTLRLLRVFRVLKLAQFVRESRMLMIAMRSSGRKIIVFLGTVVTIVIIVGTAMYLVEGAEHGFTSIPKSMYWAVVTMTTVGYGDIAPQTVPGRFLASILMIMGYGIIAVPTGIVTVEMAGAMRRGISTQACRACSAEGHDPDARYCKICGEAL